MENSLQIQPTNTSDIVRLGKVFFESGMFSDLSNMAQAIVKVQAGAELGITPFQSIAGVHVIKGKAVIGAGLMASMIDRHPEYDYAVLQHNDKVCEISFYKNGKHKGTSTFTEEDARKAGTQNMGKYPKNMLYARAMSNGVKWYCPGVFAGPVYVPEEMTNEPVQDVAYTEVKPVTAEAAAPKAEAVQEKAPAPTTAEVRNAGHGEARRMPGNALDVPENQITAGATVRYAGAEQKDEIQRLLNTPVITRQEKVKMLLNINRFDEERAAQAIEKLKKVIDERENGQPAPEEGYSIPEAIRATDEQKAEIIKRIQDDAITEEEADQVTARLDSLTQTKAIELLVELKKTIVQRKTGIAA